MNNTQLLRLVGVLDSDRARRLCAAALVLLLLCGCGPKPVTVEIVETPAPTSEPATVRTADAADFVLNPDTRRFHLSSCSWAEKIGPERRIDYNGERQTLIDVGYQPCHYCKP